jgi:hypothetical protein
MRGLVRQHSHHTQFARAESASAVTEILSKPDPPRLLDHGGASIAPIGRSQLFILQPLKISPFGLESAGPDPSPAGRSPPARSKKASQPPHSDPRAGQGSAATRMPVQGRAMRGSHGAVATQDAEFDTCGFDTWRGCVRDDGMHGQAEWRSEGTTVVHLIHGDDGPVTVAGRRRPGLAPGALEGRARLDRSRATASGWSARTPASENGSTSRRATRSAPLGKPADGYSEVQRTV